MSAREFAIEWRTKSLRHSTIFFAVLAFACGLEIALFAATVVQHTATVFAGVVAVWVAITGAISLRSLLRHIRWLEEGIAAAENESASVSEGWQ